MRLIRILAACIAAATCAPDAPVAPEPPADPATAQSGALSAAEWASLAAAISDAQEWLLPSSGERSIATDAVAERFADLARSLAQADAGAFVLRVTAARRELEAATAAEPAERIRFAVLGLALDGVEPVVRDRLGLVPLDAA